MLIKELWGNGVKVTMKVRKFKGCSAAPKIVPWVPGTQGSHAVGAHYYG
jgi:hypothetical protein